MTKQLFIIRHGKSDWSSPFGSDFERPLNKRGRRQARQLGVWMVAQGILPDIIVSSPAMRAKQTSELVNESLDMVNLCWQEDLYLAGLSTLLNITSYYLQDYSNVMLVGHNPGLETLLEAICPGVLPVTDNGKLLTTANLAQVELEVAASTPFKGKLLRLIRPKDIS